MKLYIFFVFICWVLCFAQESSRLSYSSNSSPSEPRLVSEPIWKVAVDMATSNPNGLETLVTNDSHIFYIHDQTLNAVQVDTGITAWSQNNISGWLLLSNDILLVAAEKRLYAFNATDGKELWKKSYSSLTDWVVSDDILVVINETEGVLAFNTQTGEKIWSREISELIIPVSDAYSYELPTELILLDNLIVINVPENCNGCELSLSSENTYVTLAVQNGVKKWSGYGGYFLGEYQDKIYFRHEGIPENMPHFSVVNKQTGEYIGAVNIDIELPRSNIDFYTYERGKMVFYQGELYLGLRTSYGDRVVRYNLATGAYKTLAYGYSLSNPNLTNKYETWLAGPQDGKVFVTTGSDLSSPRIVNNAGYEVRYDEVNAGITQLDVSDNGLYVALVDGQLFGFYMLTGEAFFRAETNARTFGRIRVIGNTAIFQAGEELLAFHIPEEAKVKLE
jgi:outer membrane protein assembly factor BamB